jgi:hypothetical protein
MSKKYLGTWIPAHIADNQTFSAAKKILLSEIFTLQKNGGARASNAHFAKRMSVSERQVRNYLSDAVAEGHVRVENGTSKRRRLWLRSDMTIACIAGALDSIETGIAVPGPSTEARQQTAPDPGNDLPPDPDGGFLDTRKAASTENTVREPEERTNENTTIGCRDFPLPEGFPSSSWELWVEHNRAQGRSLTPAAMKLQLSQIVSLDQAGSPPKEVIEQSILRGWNGLFEVPANQRPRRHVRMDGEIVWNPLAVSKKGGNPSASDWARHAR